MGEMEGETPAKVNIARTINLGQAVSTMIDIHVLGDASLLGTYVVAYAVVRRSPPGTKQGMIASKSRLSKKQLTISRLELVAAQMAANLADKIRNSLTNYKN